MPSRFRRTIHEPEIAPASFNSDPEEALTYAEARVFDRYNAEAFRASLAFFEGIRPRSAGKGFEAKAAPGTDDAAKS